MMPPVIRRCPACGHVTWSRRFGSVGTGGAAERLACPACEHQFAPMDAPWLN